MIFRSERVHRAPHDVRDSFSNSFSARSERAVFPNLDRDTSFENDLRKVGSVCMAGGPALPGGPNLGDLRRATEKRGRWHRPENNGDDEKKNKKAYTYNVENIAAYVGAVAIKEASITATSYFHAAAGIIAPFAFPFLVGFSASRLDSALDAKGPSGFFGTLFSSFSLIGGVAIIGRALFTFGASALLDAGLFVTGYVAGRVLKKYT